ncbi:MAG: Penicillin-binding protein 2 [Parcubacteria group bacterium Greene0416_79]|nr:MAG: Penicillin-binding protein 2 [Parcubacteria group bacterium Greene0416_79]
MLFSFFTHLIRRRKAPRDTPLDPDEIFLDARNLPRFNPHQFEGRLERPVSRRTIAVTGLVFLLFSLIFLGKSFALQLYQGDAYKKRSEENRLRHTLLFGERGIIYDRTGEPLAWNEPSDSVGVVAKRRYAKRRGLSHVLGFLNYPKKDRFGFYYQVDFEGMAGIEKYFNEYVAPSHGLKIVETDALGAPKSESVFRRARDGTDRSATVDARVSQALYDSIAFVADERGFTGGAGVVIDVLNGEILALVSVPEYDSQALTDGEDRARIARFVSDTRTPFLNRATDGLYSPGSIVKPFVAFAALEERIIAPETELYSSGLLSVPNPYDQKSPTLFRDWRAHGWVSMRRALALSSDIYFYIIGGGFEKQRGLGIDALARYFHLFGFGELPSNNPFFGAAGVVPSPRWKQEHFQGEEWRLGNTYHTAIGQYGFQVTPLQAARAVAALANGGKLLEPRIVREPDEPPVYSLVQGSDASFSVVREGMREAVRSGTAVGINLPAVSVAAKTGTAEVGRTKRLVNSWVIGFFPYEAPRFAFAIVLERGPSGNTVGALFAARRLLEWMSVYTPLYLAPKVDPFGVIQ